MNILRAILRRINYFIFILNGRKPWGWGYHSYKRKHIEDVLQNGSFDENYLPAGYGFRIDERIIEYPWLFSRLPAGKGRLLDAGSILNYDFLLSQKVLDEKKIFISTLAPEPYCFWERGISYVYEDMRQLCYRDEYYNWIVCISTIEHIGLDNTFLYTGDISMKEEDPDSYKVTIKELYRVLKPGGSLYLSFPFGKRSNHGWFQVFDEGMLDEIISVFSPTALKESHFRYESDGWYVSSRERSKDATCFDIHHQKRHDPDYAAFSRSVVCLELIK